MTLKNKIIVEIGYIQMKINRIIVYKVILGVFRFIMFIHCALYMSTIWLFKIKNRTIRQMDLIIRRKIVRCFMNINNKSEDRHIKMMKYLADIQNISKEMRKEIKETEECFEEVDQQINNLMN